MSAVTVTYEQRGILDWKYEFVLRGHGDVISVTGFASTLKGARRRARRDLRRRSRYFTETITLEDEQ